MNKEQLKPVLEQLISESSLGEVLDALEDIALEQHTALRAVDRITLVTWATASLRIGEAARFALNIGL